VKRWSSNIISVGKRRCSTWHIARRYIRYLCVKWLHCEAFEEVADEGVENIS
jgi:hypothetical protein